MARLSPMARFTEMMSVFGNQMCNKNHEHWVACLKRYEVHATLREERRQAHWVATGQWNQPRGKRGRKPQESNINLMSVLTLS